MVRSELASKLAAKNSHLSPVVIERIVATFIDLIVTALSRGDRVELRGFGSFSTRERPAYVARNPRSRTKVEVPTKFSPHFKTSSRMHSRLNG
jgi:integration host factor subunit beta